MQKQMFVVAALCVMGLALTSCGKRADTPQNREADAVADTQIAVKARLRDPESAEFSGIHTTTRDGVIFVCGYVNANNGFGGRSGEQRFIGNGSTVFLSEDGEQAISDAWDMAGC
jgi:hypothetical protein